VHIRHLLPSRRDRRRRRRRLRSGRGGRAPHRDRSRGARPPRRWPGRGHGGGSEEVEQHGGTGNGAAGDCGWGGDKMNRRVGFRLAL
jgi:hypothetical protein